MKKLSVNNFWDCILGGAIGDALGSTVKEKTYDIIVEEYGKKGIITMIEDCDNRARVTDNTQLTIFTIDSLIRAYTKYYLYGITGMGTTIAYTSYLRWQYTQGRQIPIARDREMLMDNYLMEVQELKYERNAETYTKEVLASSDLQGVNDNKGYLCLAKSAPVGLVFNKKDEDAFEMAIKIAQITHGHSSAYLSAGLYAVIIANLVRGNKLEVAIQNGINMIKDKEGNRELMEKIKLAVNMSEEKVHYPEKLDDFGLCGYAYEAIAAAIYVCLVFKDDISKALLYAVNSNCYGNNIATIVGSILALSNGLDDITKEWSKKVEMYDLYKSLASDLYCTVIEELPQEVEGYNKELTFDKIKYNNEYNVANWWMVKYDKD